MQSLRIAVLLVCAAPCSAAAQGAVVQTEQVRAELVVDAPNGLAAGRVAWLGLALAHQAHWHSYWKNPGDSGMATTLRWTLPSGATAGAIDWPTPQRLPVGPLVNYGYEGELLLAVPLTLAQGARATPLEVKLNAQWLVCKDVCIPQSGEFALRITAGSSDAALVQHGAAFARARATLPRTLPGVTPIARVDAQALALDVQGLPPTWQGRAIDFFAEDAG
ncbi:MAG: protein-disulfide reductase DsbD domain-containing protein, partial [Burkholderiaceae bacterium]